MKGKKGSTGSRYVYKQQFAVIVICSNATEQKRVYERLLQEGLKLRVVVV